MVITSAPADARAAQATDATSTAPTQRRITLAGRSVSRLGFGAARLTAGDGWGRPEDPVQARRLLRLAIDEGYDYIDSADALGPGVSDEIIGDVIHPAHDVLVASKVGMLRTGPHGWAVLGRPDYLRQQVHATLVRLRREQIPLLYLHRIDPEVPVEDQWGTLRDLRDEGLIGHLGVCEPTVAQLDLLTEIETPAVVQSLYNVAAPRGAAIADRTRELGIPFVAYWALIGRGLKRPVYDRVFEVLGGEGRAFGLSAAQTALAWILSTRADSLALVGSRSLRHLAENRGALDVQLPTDVTARIAADVATALDGTAFDPRNAPEGAL
ncbi:MAG: aldo/keto reductase [Microbacterium sp.]|uniref:aldo/keto reductase n=1 Tax=Microbacterium sp. TaxID=51671 RepID=UPI003D6EBCB4